MHLFPKSALFAIVLLFGVELGNVYSMQLANNLPSKETFDHYFGVLSPVMVKFYLYHYQYLKIDSIS
jgi:hypothetical protein